MTEATPRVSVAIIGAGIGGLTFAIALKRQLQFEDFIIYEKADDVGGTWRDNCYPGCSSDIPIHWYSLYSDLDPDWPNVLAYQPQIEAYWKKLTRKYGLYQKICFRTRVLSAIWDTKQEMYHVTTRSRDGKEAKCFAKVVVSAVGMLSEPAYPPGVEDEINKPPDLRIFKGPMWHSSRWSEAIPLHGKTVAVVGNAASGAQFIPVIAKDPSVKIVNVCRTPNWYISLPNPTYNSITKWIFARVPLAMRAHYYYVSFRDDLFFSLNKYTPYGRLSIKVAKEYILSRAPKKYHGKIVPDFPIGCKRYIVDVGYLDSLHRDNVEVNWNGFREFYNDGVVTGSGEHVPVDAVIFATGFKVSDYPVKIVGPNGSIQQFYDSQGGPTAHIGTTVPTFPNFFLIYGTHLFRLQASFFRLKIVNYSLQILSPILQGHISSISVTQQACDDFNTYIQSQLSSKNSPMMKCTSWFRAGADQSGKVISTFPEPWLAFWWYLRRPAWGDFEAALAGYLSSRYWAGARRSQLLLLWFSPCPADGFKRRTGTFESMVEWTIT
ncbi:FAD/NAD-binding domain-containing protein [Neolentinus lepideus HHB14362 ss-1]|uniref:FAD/NAD-binding domain-containing protein n=1 Tax=Neolentinus lepideus HHB14362 ss-1 TaxID=1314782 RepID=A0A165MUJ2_9AGAM|nr:FAD/NAD-binding domain-containing protein [Neolentinus lepideus HHB14362 ss-1]